MSFVGTRPEVTKYVKKYTKEMRATLLLPAGITSEASIQYKDEAELLDAADDVDRVYVEKVLPEKMKYNLESIRKFSFLREIATMAKTLVADYRLAIYYTAMYAYTLAKQMAAIQRRCKKIESRLSLNLIGFFNTCSNLLYYIEYSKTDQFQESQPFPHHRRDRLSTLGSYPMPSATS